MHDCIVVGGGLSGLYAAYLLNQAGKDVVVLEARPRVGGRIWTVYSEGVPFDLGAQWIGEDHHRLKRLVDEFGLPTKPTPTGRDGGLVSVLFGGKAIKRGGLGPIETWPLNLCQKIAAVISYAHLAWLTRRVAPSSWLFSESAARAADDKSFAAWVKNTTCNESVANYLSFLTGSGFCSDAGQMSARGVGLMLHRYGGPANLEGADRDIFVQGTSHLTALLAARLSNSIQTATPVAAIRYTKNQVEVETSKGLVTAPHAIVAIPPACARSISLPADNKTLDQLELLREMIPGEVTKYIIDYDAAFWRRKDLTGRYVGDVHPVDMVFDGTPEGVTSRARLVAFVRGTRAREWSRLGVDERRNRVLTLLRDHFGDEALKPKAFFWYDWTADEWSGGGFGAVYPLGALTRYGCTFAAPKGSRIHWAGTETADEWPNYMEGALQAGERAANEVLEGLA